MAKYVWPFLTGYKPQLTDENYEIVAIFSRKSPTYSIRLNKMRLSVVNFIRKNWSKSFNNGLVYDRVGFKSICTTISRQYTELIYIILTAATKSGRSMGGCNFGNKLSNNVWKCHTWKIHVFLQKISNSPEFFYLEPFLIFHQENCSNQDHCCQEKQNHSEICITVKVSRRTQ